MKKIRICAFLMTVILCVGLLCSCNGNSRNMKEELPGEWFIWHWYFNIKDGDNGFFDEAQFYTFDANGTITIKVGEETTTATYKFSKNDTIDVEFADGTTDTFQLIPAVHDGVNQIQFMNVNTNYTLTLEPMSSWH